VNGLKRVQDFGAHKEQWDMKYGNKGKYHFDKFPCLVSASMRKWVSGIRHLQEGRLNLLLLSLTGYHLHDTTTNWSIEWNSRGLSKRGRRMWEYTIKRKFFFLKGVLYDQERDGNNKAERACSCLHTMIMNMKLFCSVIKWQCIVNGCPFVSNNWRISTEIYENEL
jgi:hypothetical protein